jgi:hypothetical protein
MGFLSEVTVVQWILIVVGLVIALPTIVDLKIFSTVGKSSLSKSKPVKANKDGLTDLVCKWECLADACRKNGLCDACDQLDAVFPLLLSSRTSDDEHKGGDVDV